MGKKFFWLLYWCDKCEAVKQQWATRLVFATYVTCPFCGSCNVEPNGIRSNESPEEFFKRKARV